MKRLLSSRWLLVTVILVVCMVLLLQNMGVASSQVPAETSANNDSTLATLPQPHVDWALASLLIGGALVKLLRPRKRKIVAAPSR
ncbi:MAG: hypothetical protein GY794_08740 [bacterium]|nr:hypothetical protein [bacterium]